MSLFSLISQWLNTDMTLAVIIVATVFITSLISGIIGMAGGMILMAVLVSLLTVPAAMVVHGAVQATANGSRAYFLREHIRWEVLPRYLVGSAFALGGFWLLAWLPPPEVVLLLIGLFPWLALALPRDGSSPVVITRPGSQLACGFLVTGAQLVAGASGPLLDLFYLNSTFDRREIVATKAITQTLGHLTKLGYYGTLYGLAAETSPLMLGAALVASIAATRVGTLILGKVSNDNFRKGSQFLILLLGALCIANALRVYW